jgi:maltooligosyltrehalose trehalohydrolase
MPYTFPAVGVHCGNNNVCAFTVWAPLRKKVELLYSGNQIAMNRDEMGYWSVTLPDIHESTEYYYLLDGERKLPDPASRHQPKGVHGASAVAGTYFRWTDNEWKGLSVTDMVLYEIHVGTFTPQGDFDGVVSKLEYLSTLGVNAIELMPVAQFPGTRNWGYDGVYPFCAQDSYGGINGLKRLVDEAHRQGMAIILDVVYNHLGPEGNYLAEFGPYFTDKYKTNWGRAINYDDAWCDGVRNFFWQNAMMWLNEFHIDGLRLDAVHSIWDNSAKHFVHALAEQVKELARSSGRKKVLIAEFDLNNPRYISAPEKGGYGLDAQWTDEFHHALHSIVTGEVDGYYEDFGDIGHLAKSFRDSYVYTGQYSLHRKKTFGLEPKHNSYDQFIVFAQNHDQVGNRLPGDRLSMQLSFEKLKLTAATYLLSPHIPMLFMGEEYGERNPFQYFISHGEEQLIDSIRKGRKDEFAYFNWRDEIPDPQSEATFRKCVLSWNYDEDPESVALLALYKFLIEFRKQRKAMKGTCRDTLAVLPCQGRVIAFERNFADDHLLIILNFDDGMADYELSSSKNYRPVIDTSCSAWKGPYHAAASVRENFVTVNPTSATVFELEQ